jgi:carboxyl-terminal processing protease
LRETDPALAAQLQVQALIGWGATQPDAAARRLAELPDPASRQEAIQEIAGQWAATDTQAALTWANNLTDPSFREQAVAAIQASAPVGIGVSLSTSPDGLPMIQELVPGGPASLGGQLKPGYQIAAVADPQGRFADVQGMNLGDVVKLIRGKPGTAVVLEVIPADGNPMNRRMITIPRQQLFFKNPPATGQP